MSKLILGIQETANSKRGTYFLDKGNEKEGGIGAKASVLPGL